MTHDEQELARERFLSTLPEGQEDFPTIPERRVLRMEAAAQELADVLRKILDSDYPNPWHTASLYAAQAKLRASCALGYTGIAINERGVN